MPRGKRVAGLGILEEMEGMEKYGDVNGSSPASSHLPSWLRPPTHPTSGSCYYLRPLLETASFCHPKEVDVVWKQLERYVNGQWR